MSACVDAEVWLIPHPKTHLGTPGESEGTAIASRWSPGLWGVLQAPLPRPLTASPSSCLDEAQRHRFASRLRDRLALVSRKAVGRQLPRQKALRAI